MTARAMDNNALTANAQAGSFSSFAGSCAFLAAIAGLLYSVAFVILKNPLLYSLCLLVGGLASLVVMVGLYERLRNYGPEFALLALLIGSVAVLGSAVHGGYDLSNAVNTPTSDPITAANLPNELDPRGLLTFGIAGLAILVFSWLLSHAAGVPRGLSYLGYVLAALMVVIYLVRLIILDPNASPLIPLALGLTGIIISPAWYAWVGLTLLRSTSGETGRVTS